MEAALTFVPIAIIVAVHTHSLVFTRPLCHPVFDLAEEGQGDHRNAWTSPSSLRARSPEPGSLLLPQTRSPQPLLLQTQELRTPVSCTSSGSSEYFSGSFLAISSSFLETQTWLLPRQKAWQGRQVPPPTAEPTNRGRHCSQWLPWKPGTGQSEGVKSHSGCESWGKVLRAPGEGSNSSGIWLGQSQPTCH